MSEAGDQDYFRLPEPKGPMPMPALRRRDQLDTRARFGAIRARGYLGMTPADFGFLCELAAAGLKAAAEGER